MDKNGIVSLGCIWDYYDGYEESLFSSVIIMRQINILWTGGLDSTYRVAGLSREKVVIQPYYIKAEERVSYLYELKAIRRITRIIRKHPKTVAELRDVIVVDEAKILPDPEISKARETLTRKFTLGTQYEFIARFLKQYNIKAEVGVLFTDRGKVARCLGDDENRLVKFCVDGYDYFEVNPAVISKESLLIFGNMVFPCSLVRITKVEEREGLYRLGLKKVYKKTWFCHTPVLGMPCGRCNPCKDAIAEGMPERVPMMGRTFGTVRIWPKQIKREIKMLFKRIL